MSSDLGKQRVEHELFLRAFLSTKPPDRVATQLSRVTRDAHLDRGDVLFEAGESPERLYFLASGRIRLEGPRGGSASGVASLVDAGSLIGMLDASIPRRRTRTATALEPTHVLALDFVDYLDILEDNFGFAVDTLRAAAESYCSLADRFDSAVVFERPEALPNAPAGAQLGELDVVERILALQHVGLLRGAPAQALVQLAHLAEVNRWNPGDMLFAGGEPVTDARIVVCGLVVARHRSNGLVGEFGSHQIVSDLEILGTQAHEFIAFAEATSVTLDIHLEDLFDVAEDHFDLWRSMLSYVASQRARLSDAACAREIDLGRMTL